MSEKLRIIPGPTRWRHECKSHGDWRSFHNGITFCPTCGMDTDGLMAEPPIPFDGSVILRRAGATHPASHDAVESVTQGFPDLLHEAGEIVRGKFVWKRFISGTPLDNDVPVWMAEFALSHIATLTAEVSRLTGENATHLNDWRDQVQKTCAALKQRNDALDELERRTQQFSTVVGRLQKKGIGLTADLERSRKECERLREAALATAGMYGRDCRESMLRAFEQAAALSAGEKHE